MNELLTHGSRPCKGAAHSGQVLAAEVLLFSEPAEHGPALHSYVSHYFLHGFMQEEFIVGKLLCLQCVLTMHGVDLMRPRLLSVICHACQQSHFVATWRDSPDRCFSLVDSRCTQ